MALIRGFLDQEQYDPAEDTGVNKPIRARIVTKEASDKYYDYPSNGLNPIRLAQILKEADAGNVRRQMELYEEIEEKDPHLYSQMQTRKLAVTGLEWEVQPFSDDEKDKEIAEFINQQLKGMDNFDNILIDLLDAVGKGISVNEIIWDTNQFGKNIICDIEHVHAKKLLWDYQTDDLKICTLQYPEGIAIPANKFVVHKYKAKSGHTSRAGVLRVCVWMYLFKNFTIKDWVSFCEIYGMPLRLGKYSAAASDEDKEQLMKAIVMLGTDAAGMIPDTAIIEFVEAQKQNSIDVYERLARYTDEQMSKAILGQTLTSDSGSGSYAQSKTHDRVRHDLTVADAKSLSITIRNDIIKPLVIFNFGADANVPLLSFDTDEPENQKEKAEVYKTLTCDMGLEIPTSHIYKTFSIPKPEEDEEVLKPPSQSTNLQQGNESITLTLKSQKKEQTEEEKQLNQVVAIANKEAGHLFEQMFTPILKLIDKTSDLKELQIYLNKEENLKKLYQDMDQVAFRDLIQQAIYISELMGRTMD